MKQDFFRAFLARKSVPNMSVCLCSPKMGAVSSKTKRFQPSFFGYHLIVVVGYHQYFDTCLCFPQLVCTRLPQGGRRPLSGEQALPGVLGGVPARAQCRRERPASSEDPVAFVFQKGFPLNATGKKRPFFFPWPLGI